MTQENKFTIGSQWRTRGGWRSVVVKSLSGGWCIAWHDCQVYGQGGKTHLCDGTVNRNRACDYDLIGPWPAEPVVFETTIQKQGYNEFYQGYIPHNEALNPFIGKRVKVTVEELP